MKLQNSKLKISMSFVVKILLFSFVFASIPLETVYENAPSRAGFDKYLELDPSEIYTGSLHFAREVTAIVSNGAVIDLQGGDGFTADGYGTEILFDGVTVTNYPNDEGIYISDGAHVTIQNCNFVNGKTGISIWNYALVEIINCNIGNHTVRGLERSEIGPTTYAKYVNTWANVEGDWKQNCLT